MNDKYPEILNIEIERGRLRNYLRVRYLLSWTFPFLFFGGLFGFSAIGKALDQDFTSLTDAVFLILRSIASGISISTLIALFCYFIFSHRIASRLASTLTVTVEGAFLHICQHTATLSDRKLHFRSIVDYATTQDCLMRYFGIYTLQMTTTAGGQHTNLIIPGVKDCLRIRDVLADIDRLREHQ